MSTQVFAQPGQSRAQVGGTCPDGWVVMQSERPTPDHIAAPSGEWVLPPDPGPQYQTQFSVLDFRERFTLAEQIAIRQAQLTDMEVGLVYDAFISAQFIDIADPRVAGGIDLYISKGLLAAERKAELLEPVLIQRQIAE